MAVAQNHRSPRHDVVDVAFAVGVKHIGTGCAIKEYRRPADSAKGSNRGVNTSGYMFLSGVEKFF